LFYKSSIYLYSQNKSKTKYFKMQIEQTQKQRLAEALKKIKPDVTMKDREAFEKETKITKTTLSYYLNGDVKDNDTAVLVLDFMRKRISKRDRILA